MLERQPTLTRLCLPARNEVNGSHAVSAGAAGVRLIYGFWRELLSPVDGVWMSV
jgi:hypothetical protein